MQGKREKTKPTRQPRARGRTDGKREGKENNRRKEEKMLSEVFRSLRWGSSEKDERTHAHVRSLTRPLASASIFLHSQCDDNGDNALNEKRSNARPTDRSFSSSFPPSVRPYVRPPLFCPFYNGTMEFPSLLAWLRIYAAISALDRGRLAAAAERRGRTDVISLFHSIEIGSTELKSYTCSTYKDLSYTYCRRRKDGAESIHV